MFVSKEPETEKTVFGELKRLIRVPESINSTFHKGKKWSFACLRPYVSHFKLAKTLSLGSQNKTNNSRLFTH